MARVRVETWEHMRENYPELWEKYGKYFSLPVEEYGPIVVYDKQAHYHVDLGMKQLNEILTEVYTNNLRTMCS